MKNKKIDAAVGELHKAIFRANGDGTRDTEKLIQLLNPELAASTLGFTIEYVPKIFNPAKTDWRTAGLMRRSDCKILVSTEFPESEQRFTALHEIAHAAIHTRQSLFRDRPVSWEGSVLESRPFVEREADDFAAKYGMPARLLRREFEKKFHIQTPFDFSENIAFHLAKNDYESLFMGGDVEVARALAFARAAKFDRWNFQPLCSQFGFSPSAMAYRLIELGLVGTPIREFQSATDFAFSKEVFEPLYGPGIHYIDELMLEEIFAFPFSPSVHRDDLVRKLRRFIGFVKTIGVPCEIWIDGSFATQKPYPNDIDIALFFHKRDVSLLTSKQRENLSNLKNRELMQDKYLCDVYVECADNSERIGYFKKQFGCDARVKIEKGIPILKIGL